MKSNDVICPFCHKELNLIKERFDVEKRVKTMVFECPICMRYIYTMDNYTYKMTTLDRWL